MGNNHSSTQRKYVLPHGGRANGELNTSAEGENETGQSTRRFSDKQSTAGAKPKSKLRQALSLSSSSSAKPGKQSKKAGLDCFDSQTKNTRPPALRQNSAPLSAPSPKKTIKTGISSGTQVLLASQRMNCSLEKLAEALAELSAQEGPKRDASVIKRDVFIKHMIPQSEIACRYMWTFLCNNQDAETITKTSFVRSAEKFYAPITDQAQVNFYLNIFGKGSDVMSKNAFFDFLMSLYQLSPNVAPQYASITDCSEPFDGKHWMEAVIKSCFHIKDEMSLCFLSNWILTNLPRILLSPHKDVLNQFTTRFAQLAAERSSPQAATSSAGLSVVDEYLLLKESKLNSKEATLLDTSETNPSNSHSLNQIMFWLLSLSVPSTYVAVFDKKPDPNRALRPDPPSSKELLMKMINNTTETDKWTMLYHSDEHGLSVNRLQFHIFNYRGPTLMFIKAENNYTFCIASDVEWTEGVRFWGGEDSMLLQLLPEFRIAEKGAKIIYTNFSIRGYPFGIQVGKDPRNVSVEIKPDFEYISFKKIPCRILTIEVWGCAPSQEKKAQVEHKKWEAREVEKQRKINLNSVDWNDNPDKYLLELGGAYKSYGNKQ